MNAMLNLAHLVAEERAMLRSNWGWFVALGVILAVMGVAGLIFVGAPRSSPWCSSAGCS